MYSCQHCQTIASSLGKEDSHDQIGCLSARDLVLTKLNLGGRNREVRSFSSDGPTKLQQASCPFRFLHNPLPIAQNPSDCINRRAALQRIQSQRFPQG